MHIAGRERPPAGKPHGEVGVTAGETATFSINRSYAMNTVGIFAMWMALLFGTWLGWKARSIWEKIRRNG